MILSKKKRERAIELLFNIEYLCYENQNKDIIDNIIDNLAELGEIVGGKKIKDLLLDNLFIV